MKSFLYRHWSEWLAAWRAIRDERRRHECISVPLVRYCELLEAERRSWKLQAEKLQVELAHERRMTDMLGSAVFGMVEQEREENACAEAEGFMLETRRFSQSEIAPYFRVVPKKRLDS